MGFSFLKQAISKAFKTTDLSRSDLTFSYLGDEQIGKVIVTHNGEQSMPVEMYKQNGKWKIDF